tara:strand:- start:73 stop:384 length:312 start_codon:yes stop_codon:yes gene_type:complete
MNNSVTLYKRHRFPAEIIQYAVHHQGDQRFFIASTPDQRYWALKSMGFPTRIIAIAQVNSEVYLEKIAGQMMRAVADQDGDYIDMIHDFGNVDIDLLWGTYTA